MKIIDQINDIALDGMVPGPAAFLHRYMWDKIHGIHIAHSNRGLYGASMAIAPNMIIDEIHKMITEVRR